MKTNIKIEKFKIEIQYWSNLEILKYVPLNDEEKKAINDELDYRISKSTRLH